MQQYLLSLRRLCFKNFFCEEGLQSWPLADDSFDTLSERDNYRVWQCFKICVAQGQKMLKFFITLPSVWRILKIIINAEGKLIGSVWKGFTDMTSYKVKRLAEALKNVHLAQQLLFVLETNSSILT